MAKYAPKKIEFVFEQVKAKPEEIEQRLSDAFAILFEETLKSIKEEEQTLKIDKNFKNINQIGEEVRSVCLN